MELRAEEEDARGCQEEAPREPQGQEAQLWEHICTREEDLIPFTWTCGHLEDYLHQGANSARLRADIVPLRAEFFRLQESEAFLQKQLQEARSEIEELKKSREACVEKDDVDREFKLLSLDLIDEVMRGYKISQEDEELGRIGWAKAAIHRLKKERDQTSKAALDALESLGLKPSPGRSTPVVVWALITRAVLDLQNRHEEAKALHQKQLQAEYDGRRELREELTTLEAENQVLKEQVRGLQAQVGTLQPPSVSPEERGAWLDLQAMALELAETIHGGWQDPKYLPVLGRARWATSRIQAALYAYKNQKAELARTKFQLEKYIESVPSVGEKFERLGRELSILKDQVVGNSK